MLTIVVSQMRLAQNPFPANLVDPKLNMADPNTRVQMQQQLHDSGYVLQAQFDHQQQQQQQQQHQQAHQQHQQAQQQQQFIHAGTHYIQHHPGSVPIPAYYPVYPSQQQQHHQHHHHPQLDQQQQQQQYQVYYMPARQAQPYTNLPVQQSNINEAATSIPSSRSQTPPNSAMIAKPDMAGGVYRTATAAAPSVVQVPPQHQQQYVGYTSQIHQSAVPSSGGVLLIMRMNMLSLLMARYTIHSLWLRTIPSQYQTMTAAAAMVLPEGSAQLPTDNIKQQR
ncbi:hypothetical protein Prudu_002803 [Prunus dulcis]|uniref:Uncharacterized protein n=1 Tax=Prunus dulcis TaxID=3755 RepID=A0A4Y1QRN7_PRUDU|nr:hypothetical protein Prudu_002803 [Prunus dulcis]